MINEEALNFMPSRHYSAYLIGLFPSIYDWVVNISGRSPLEAEAVDGGSYNSEYPQGASGWVGVLAWKRGALLVSMVWVAMVVYVLDRKWVLATVWALVGAIFAVFGIIHMPEAGFKSFGEPVWEQCEGFEDEATEQVFTPTCWEHAEQWMFFVAYCMLAGTFGIIEVCKRFDDSIKEPIDDPSAHAFDDWFKDAAKGAEDTSEDEKEIPKPELQKSIDEEDVDVEEEEEEQYKKEDEDSA